MPVSKNIPICTPLVFLLSTILSNNASAGVPASECGGLGRWNEDSGGQRVSQRTNGIHSYLLWPGWAVNDTLQLQDFRICNFTFKVSNNGLLSIGLVMPLLPKVCNGRWYVIVDSCDSSPRVPLVIPKNAPGTETK